MLKKIIWCVLIVLTVTSCALFKSKTQETDITTVEWRLSSVRSTEGSKVKAITLPKEIKATMIVTKTNVSGSTGCNRFNGTTELGRDKVKFSGVVATRRACLNGMNIEAAFLKALNAAESYKVKGKKLYLIDKLGTLAVFSPIDDAVWGED